MHNKFQLQYILLLSLFTVVFSFRNANAAVPVVHQSAKPNWISAFKPYDKKPSARNVQDGAYDELVEEQINVDAKTTYNHIITVIATESGVQDNSEISVSFNPAYEQLNFHELTIWRNGKPQNRLNTGAFKMLPNESELDKFIYNGTYSAKYILADIRKGDKIEYAYSITGRNPVFDGKFCRTIYLQGSNLIMHLYTTMLFSAVIKLNIKPFNLLSQPKITEVNGLKRYEWEDFEVPGAVTNKFEPKWVNTYARVQVSGFGSWADVVNWGMRINPLQTTFTGELADTVANLKKQYGNNKKKYFRAAVTLVQDEVRYMGIETGAYSHKANLPDRVFKQRYGDCKDKSLLLASILNANGIEAHLALINTDFGSTIDNYIPSATLFDHAVVVATVNGKQVWVDATMANQRGKGTDIYFPPYKRGLVLKPGNQGLTVIPETKAGKIVEEEKYNITDEFAPVKFTVKTIYTLNEADGIRDDIATTGTGKMEKNYLDYYAKTYNKIEVADSLVVKDNEAKNELTTIESYKITNFLKRDSVNGKYTADFYADDISRQLPDVGGQIKTPVSVTYPYDGDYTVKITMPNGWDIADKHYALNRNSYIFKLDHTVSHDNLYLHYQFTYLKDYIPAAELADFKKDVKDLKDEKLSFSFYYIPDIKKVPFQLNHWMLILTFIVMAGFAYGGFNIYKQPTVEVNYFTKKAVPPALGGWLIVLLIVFITTPLGIIKIFTDEDYFSMSKWHLFNVGLGSSLNKALIAFKVAGYVAVICYSLFCLLLIIKKRDITVYHIKRFYIFVVLFLFVKFFFNGVVKNDYSSYEMEQIIKPIIVAALWTYYLNTSERVRQTFIVPYPN